MKTEIKTFINSSNSSKYELTRNYLIHPLNEGLFGFAIFFIVLVAIKFMNYLLGFSETFNIEINDILLSGLGFICFFLIAILNNFKRD